MEEGFPECCVDGIPRMSLVFEAAAAEMLEAMLHEAARNRPDLITWVWPVDYAGAVAARVLGVPGIAMATSAVVPLDLYASIASGPPGRLREGVVPEPNRTAPAITQAMADVLADEQHRQRASVVASEMNGTSPGPAVVRRLVSQLLGRGASAAPRQ